jgi:ABC-2 type transport system ATP-binding protein
LANDAVVHFDRVNVRYGAVHAVRDLSFAVERGEMFGLIGPDGAGKTTTIRTLCGLLTPASGEVSVLGVNPTRQHGRLTESVGYLSQQFSLYTDLSVDENIAFFAEIHGIGDFAPIRDRLLSMTQMAAFHDRLAGQLSGGMKQKLALACTLIHSPRLIVLDEPTTGVDPVARREFWKLLGEFLSQGLTIIMSTPYLDEAERCTRVALLHEGRLMALDTPAAIRATLPGTLIEVVADDHRRVAEALRTMDGVARVELFGERAHVRFGTDDPEAERRVRDTLERAGIRAVEIRQVSASLEDVFVARLAEVRS